MVTRHKSGITKPKQPFCLSTTISENTEPTCYSEAVQDPKWRRAMFEEYQALQNQGTWTLVPSSHHKE